MMELDFHADPSENLLPFDGEAYYHPKIFVREEADQAFQILSSSIHWRQDVVKMFGKEITLSRKVAWYGDQPFAYCYSGTTHVALPWTEELIKIKTRIESIVKEKFNCCLLNFYHNGNEKMGWHADDEPELKRHAAIASLSLGTPRKFSFKHKKLKQTHSLLLEHGSLLIMKGPVQERWLHQLPAAKKILSPRVNLTFRLMNGGDPS